MKSVYYAHSMSLYNTPQEKRDIELLELMGFIVVNPNDLVYRSAVGLIITKGEAEKLTKDQISQQIMDMFFKEVIPQCDALTYRSFVDMKIGAGVWGEVQCALKLKKPVFELPTLTAGRMLDIAETRNYLTLLGER